MQFLVILSISDFGRDNDCAHWQATTPVLHALTSQLSWSGIPGREPLVPPGRNLPYQVAAAQAAVFAVGTGVPVLAVPDAEFARWAIGWSLLMCASLALRRIAG